MKKYLAILIGLIILVALIGGSRSSDRLSEVSVAGCPTFYYLLERLSEEGVGVVKTNSTAESISYLQQGKADMVIGGRALMPSEPPLSSFVVGEGYSFFSSFNLTIHEKEMSEVPFFTDLKKEEIIRDFPSINPENLEEVNDVYNHLNEGIAISRVENTDYTRAKVVYVIGDNNKKVRMSRTPVLYYDQELVEEKLINAIIEIVK